MQIKDKVLDVPVIQGGMGVPLQRTLWSITLTFGPAARRCSSA